MLAVEVLVQAVEDAWDVFEQQRGRPRLPSLMATGEEVGVALGIPDVDAEGLVPAIARCDEARIERGPQLGDGAGQGRGEVLVLAAPETVPRHDDAAAERRVLWIEPG